MASAAQTRMARVLAAGAFALMAGCGGGFGAGNTTNPGNTPNLAAQSSFRIVGDVGTPFIATVADAQASWVISGTVPQSIIIVNNLPATSTAARILVTKLANDSRLLSVEIISGFTIKTLSSTTENYGSALGALNPNLQPINGFPPPASPDVRFLIKGPSTGIFDATIESRNLNLSSILQSRAPATVLFDLGSGDSSDRVDGIFNEVGFSGPFNINLIIDGRITEAIGGTSVTIKGDT